MEWGGCWETIEGILKKLDMPYKFRKTGSGLWWSLSHLADNTTVTASNRRQQMDIKQ